MAGLPAPFMIAVAFVAVGVQYLLTSSTAALAPHVAYAQPVGSSRQGVAEAQSDPVHPYSAPPLESLSE
eukprot:scaffold18711_cov119-Isochrysis_galbana.AAC.2